MRVGLVQVDGSMPNLALMKLSAWHKSQGDEVVFRTLNHPIDKLYISCIFTKNAAQAKGIGLLFPEAEVVFGGYGISGVSLPDRVEHTYPDYELYGIDYAMGYTSRGCIRKCPFCFIPKYEGMIREHSPFEEFWRGQEKMVLLDPNFLASPKRYEKLEWLREKGIKINFNQGLDLRLVNEKAGELLREIKAMTHTFKSRMYHFAWDNIKDEEKIKRGIEILKGAGIPVSYMMVYFLIGYDSDFENEMYRFEELRKMGVHPFAMVYDKRDPLRRGFSRWVNRRLYKVTPWSEYSYGCIKNGVPKN